MLMMSTLHCLVIAKKQVDNPLKWMDNWLNPDKIQTANQEIANGNYLLGVVVDDVDGEIV